MSTVLRSPARADARELTLTEVARQPGIQQRALATRLSEQTGLAESTLIKLFQRLAREGELEAGLDGRRRTYRLPLRQPSAEPVDDADIAAAVDDLIADVATEAAPEPQSQPDAPDGPAAPVAPPRTAGSRLLACVAGGVLLLALLVAFVLPRPEGPANYAAGDPPERTRAVAPSPEPAAKPPAPAVSSADRR